MKDKKQKELDGGRPKCFVCGAALVWDNDNNASDVYETYEGDDEAVVTSYHCPRCGYMYEVLCPPREERENEYKEYYGKS